MPKDPPDTLPGMMAELRKLLRQLEELLANSVAQYEETTGLRVEDVELIRTMEVGESSGTRIRAVKLTVRL